VTRVIVNLLDWTTAWPFRRLSRPPLFCEADVLSLEAGVPEATGQALAAADWRSETAEALAIGLETKAATLDTASAVAVYC
jgi:hypothetical protein